MIQIKKFTFNPFQENTYILYDDTKECIIVDPGCYNSSEQNTIAKFIEENDLLPVKLLNTHAHIDHVLGNQFIATTYKLGLELYQSDHPMLDYAKASAKLYNIPYDESPEPSAYIKEGDVIEFGNSSLDVLYVPGHAPDHIVFLHEEQKFLIGGDVLFKRSIGRTDLPGGNHEQLLANIKEKIFTLHPSITVYSGHGEETTIMDEVQGNPFF